MINNSISIWKGKPLKSLTFGLKKTGGRNSIGRICSFKKGGGCKRKYRLIDFKRNIYDIPAIVRRIEYDPNRSAFIALICYKNGILSYIISSEGLKIDDHVMSYSFKWKNWLESNNNEMGVSSNKKVKEKFKIGSTFPLSLLPVGTIINNIQLRENQGAKLIRSAGTFAIVSEKFQFKKEGLIVIRLASGIEYLISNKCRATVGIVSNVKYGFRNRKKAGVNRLLGIRPTVRGVAMNPIDHPHGGGEGRKSGRRNAMSPWGKFCKGPKTRNRGKTRKFILKLRKIKK